MPSILVVENDPLSRELAERVLRAGGHRVHSVDSAEAAIERVRSATSKPDLVLMDMRLPGMDGIDATRVLTGDPATAGVAVALLSGQAFDEDVRRARDAGCADFLAKPIEARELLGRVEAILAGRGSRGRIRRKP